MLRLITVRLLAMVTSCVMSGSLLFAGASPDQQAYVVTLRPDASIDGIRVVARQMAASYGGTVVDGAGSGEDTFVIRLPQSRAKVLASDPHVKSIAPMSLRPEPQAVVETVNWSSGVSYSYDGSGNISQIGSDAFVYDSVSRLVKATVNGVNRTYQYDAYGNRTACNQLGTNDCQGFSIDATENKNRIAGAGYDAGGNVTNLSGHIYSYDPLNMMTRDSFGALAREFVYTADDERIATYTVGSSWSWTVRGTDGKVLREFASNDGPAGPGTTSWRWTKDNVWRNALLLASRQPDGTSTTTYHYHLDHLGTPRRVTDQNERIVGVHDYLAYGPELSTSTAESSATALKYTGHERDNWSSATDSLDYMHARYYNPTVGRFWSVDPGKDWNVHQPQSWNMYAYVQNNPINAIDPTGMNIFKDLWDWGVGLFVREKPENDRAQQAQQLADDPATGVTQAEAKSQKASTARDGLKEGVTTVGAALTEAAATAVLFKGVNKAGEAIVTRLEITGHALERMAERGITVQRIQSTVSTGQRFTYFHEGIWKVGFYDPQSRTFVAAAAGRVLTVINNVKPQYVENLKKLAP